MDNINSSFIKKNNNKSHSSSKSGINNVKLLAVGALLIITPLVSTPLRLTYLYFIVNILIIAVGADAGLLSFLLQSRKQQPHLQHENGNNNNVLESIQVTNELKTVRNLLPSDKTIANPDAVDDEIEKTPFSSSSSSRPSIFFIASAAGNEEAVPIPIPIPIPDQEMVEDGGNKKKGDELLLEGGEDSELFEKAEMFIGNFYKQLKMQIREEQPHKLK